MRSASSLRLVALAALGASACGDFSTDDIAFLEALPTRESMRVSLPGSAGAALCGGLGDAKSVFEARDGGAKMNAALEFVLTIVDVVRTLPPSKRRHDERIWGPFPDRNHPGVEIQFTIHRNWQGDFPTFDFAFEARRPADGTGWASIIDGQFVGASARTGRGLVTLRFPTVRALGMFDPLDPPPRFDVPIQYDRSRDPRTLSVHVRPGDGGSGLVDFTYGFSRWSAGDVRLDFALANAAGDRAEEAVRFTPAGAGRADVTFFPSALPGFSYTYSVCWSQDGCVSALNDPRGYSGYPGCVAGTPCTSSWPAGCPAVR